MSRQTTLDPKPSTGGEGRRADRDRRLVEALQQQEPTAAEQLIATYGDRAYRLASSITGNGTFSFVITSTFRGESAFGSWFYRIVANAAYQKLRGRQGRRRELSLDEVLPVFDEASRHVAPMIDWSPRVDDPSVQTELRAALTSAINELPAVYRTVLVLRDVEGRSTLEIADALRLSVPNVKSRVHRARLFVRKRLGGSMTTMDTATTTAYAS